MQAQPCNIRLHATKCGFKLSSKDVFNAPNPFRETIDVGPCSIAEGVANIRHVLDTHDAYELRVSTDNPGLVERGPSTDTDHVCECGIDADAETCREQGSVDAGACSDPRARALTELPRQRGPVVDGNRPRMWDSQLHVLTVPLGPRAPCVRVLRLVARIVNHLPPYGVRLIIYDQTPDGVAYESREWLPMFVQTVARVVVANLRIPGTTLTVMGDALRAHKATLRDLIICGNGLGIDADMAVGVAHVIACVRNDWPLESLSVALPYGSIGDAGSVLGDALHAAALGSTEHLREVSVDVSHSAITDVGALSLARAAFALYCRDRDIDVTLALYGNPLSGAVVHGMAQYALDLRLPRAGNRARLHVCLGGLIEIVGAACALVSATREHVAQATCPVAACIQFKYDASILSGNRVPCVVFQNNDINMVKGTIPDRTYVLYREQADREPGVCVATMHHVHPAICRAALGTDGDRDGNGDGDGDR